jgi:hypothetical protein
MSCFESWEDVAIECVQLELQRESTARVVTVKANGCPKEGQYVTVDEDGSRWKVSKVYPKKFTQHRLIDVFACQNNI